MSDIVQSIEDLIERLVKLDASVKRLKTASVSGSILRQEAKDIHKDWLPVCGLLEQEQILDAVAIEQTASHLDKLRKLADGKNPKSQYKPLLRSTISHVEETSFIP